MSWTEADVEALRVGAADGLSARQISEKVGRSRNSVISAAHRYGVQLLGGSRGSSGLAQKIGARMRRGGGWLKKKGPPKDVPPSEPRKFRTRKTVRDLLAALPATEAGDSGHVPANLVSFEDLEPHHCRYVHGDVHNGRWGYCGGERVPGLSYCADHARRCYRVPETDRLAMGALKLFHKVGA